MTPIVMAAAIPSDSETWSVSDISEQIQQSHSKRTCLHASESTVRQRVNETAFTRTGKH
jgi:hypothetical protein